jgi:ferredoxin-like protein FixX
MDGSHACLHCVEDLVKSTGEARAVKINDKFCANLSPDEVFRLNEAAEMSADIMGCSEEVAILRFIASKAKRTNRTIDEVANEVIEKESVDYILW